MAKQNCVLHFIDYIFPWAVIIRMGQPWTFRLVMPLMMLPPDLQKKWRPDLSWYLLKNFLKIQNYSAA